MAQIILTGTVAAPREQVWSVIQACHAHGDLCEGLTTKKLGEADGIGARRRVDIAGNDMTEEVVTLDDLEELSLVAKEFHNAAFAHFVTTFRLAGPAAGPTSIAIAVDFGGGITTILAKPGLQKVFKSLLAGITEACLQATPQADIAITA